MLRFVVGKDGTKDYGDLSAVGPPYTVSMRCESCRTKWLGCWDNFQCPECGEGELPKATDGNEF
jgi:exosome complex RNA-binding protein Csl4